MINTTRVSAALYNIDLDIADGAVSLTNAAIGFTAAQVEAASRVVIGIEAQAIRIARGGAATSTNGLRYAAATQVTFEGANNIRALSIIALADNAVLQIELES